MSDLSLLPESFYDRPVAEVARALIGQVLRRGSVVLRITEVEAYAGPEDSASHARAGRTARNAAMWGPPGRAYVFRCYGIHHLLNVVTGPDGSASAVLVRAAEPLAGVVVPPGKRAAACVVGPGRVGAALPVDLGDNHQPLFCPGDLELAAGEPPPRVLSGPRIGIPYASPADRRRPWRFAWPDLAWVSHPGLLTGGTRRRSRTSAPPTGR